MCMLALLILHQILQVRLLTNRCRFLIRFFINRCHFLGTVFGLCQTVGAAGLLAANYVVSEGLHGSVSVKYVKIPKNRLACLVCRLVEVGIWGIFSSFVGDCCFFYGMG